MMKKSICSAAMLAALGLPAAAMAQDSAEITEVKRLVEQMRRDYEQKIQALEERLRAAERKAETAASEADAARQVVDSAAGKDRRGGMAAVGAGNAFNPQISVILDGNYYQDDRDGEGFEMLGMADGISHAHGAHGHGHDHGGHGAPERGFNFRSAEIAISATVDPYFDANLMLALDGDSELEVEEAWFQTRALPHGLKVRGGKFLSGVGYANSQHPHEWAFVDQNLAYLNLLGDHGLRDTGVQLTWLPDWGHYTLFGFEALQGDQEKLGALAGDELIEEAAAEAGVSEYELGLGSTRHGPRLYTAFVKYAPDLGYDHALQLGLWGGWANQHTEIHEEPVIHALQGNASMWGLDAVYKYDAGGTHGAGDVIVQGEYLWQRKDLNLSFHETNPALVGAEREFTQDGFYLQGLFGIAPRWKAGLRYDKVGLTNRLDSGGSTLREWDSSDRWTAALTWNPTEFSQLRLQYAKADITIDGQSEDFDYLYLQYVMSLGAHGAHKF
mgnify:FL=1